MRCIISLRRNNFLAALNYLDKIIVCLAESNDASEEAISERKTLLNLVVRTRYFYVEEFFYEFVSEPQAALRRFTGIPVILTGYVRYVIHYKSEIPYLVFNLDQEQNRTVYCQAPRSEIPFIKHLSKPQNARVVGYPLIADASKIVLQPVNLIT